MPAFCVSRAPRTSCVVNPFPGFIVSGAEVLVPSKRLPRLWEQHMGHMAPIRNQRLAGHLIQGIPYSLGC